MDNQEKSSKWDELARELGAEAPPEPVIVPKSTRDTESEPAESRHKRVKSPPRPKPNPLSWDSLAADLDVEVPPPPPTPPPTLPAMSPSPDEPVESPPPEAVSKRSEDQLPHRPRQPRREESAYADDRPARPPREDRPRPPRERQPRRRRDESLRHGREESPQREREDSPTQLMREEPSSPSAAPESVVDPEHTSSLKVSLWHKIFGSPDEQAERIAESAGAADTVRRVESAPAHDDRPRDSRRGQRHEEPPLDRTEEEAVEVSEPWPQESSDIERVKAPDAEGRARRSRDEHGESRRRRRGRGRGRQTNGGQRESSGEVRSSEPAEKRADGPRQARERRVEREPRRHGGRSARPRRAGARKQDDLTDDLDDGLEEIILDDDSDTDEMDLGTDVAADAEPARRGAPAGHKSMPSWDDAIGIIVDGNLATRTDRRRSAAPQARGSGRSRGGRRRKKP